MYLTVNEMKIIVAEYLRKHFPEELKGMDDEKLVSSVHSPVYVGPVENAWEIKVVFNAE
jgi:hypothetical protein